MFYASNCESVWEWKEETQKYSFCPKLFHDVDLMKCSQEWHYFNVQMVITIVPGLRKGLFCNTEPISNIY